MKLALSHYTNIKILQAVNELNVLVVFFGGM